MDSADDGSKGKDTQKQVALKQANSAYANLIKQVRKPEGSKMDIGVLAEHCNKMLLSETVEERDASTSKARDVVSLSR